MKYWTVTTTKIGTFIEESFEAHEGEIDGEWHVIMLDWASSKFYAEQVDKIRLEIESELHHILGMDWLEPFAFENLHDAIIFLNAKIKPELIRPYYLGANRAEYRA